MSLPMPTLAIILSPAHKSFPFSSKKISVQSIARNTIPLGVPDVNSRSAIPKRENGWFSPVPNDEAEESAYPGPLSVSSSHALLYMEDSQVFIRDLDSAYGTFVNDVRISGTVGRRVLPGDVIRLGTPIARNKGTPAYVTDDQLLPIIARVDYA